VLKKRGLPRKSVRIKFVGGFGGEGHKEERKRSTDRSGKIAEGILKERGKNCRGII